MNASNTEGQSRKEREIQKGQRNLGLERAFAEELKSQRPSFNKETNGGKSEPTFLSKEKISVRSIRKKRRRLRGPSGGRSRKHRSSAFILPADEARKRGTASNLAGRRKNRTAGEWWTSMPQAGGGGKTRREINPERATAQGRSRGTKGKVFGGSRKRGVQTHGFG